MKKLALVFVVLSILVFVGCSTSSFVASDAPELNVEDKNKEVVLDESQSEQKEKTIKEELEFVLDEICKQDKQFERNTNGTYRSCNTDELLSFATEEELIEIQNLVDAIETAIENGESLLPKENSLVTGAEKLVEDLDSLLFSIWHSVLSQK